MKQFPLIPVLVACALLCPPLWADERDEKDDEEVYELQELTITARRPFTAASDKVVRDHDFEILPRQNPSDVLRVLPGLHVSQHTGGAKAYQYFLRGFDAEHGRDLAVYLDGIPLNEPSQTHGHGYLDLHFLIPESLDRIRIIKGSYDPEYGNFATAGAIDLITRTRAAVGAMGAGGGSHQTMKAIAYGGTTGARYTNYLAAEWGHTAGFTDPGRADAYRGFTSQTIPVGAASSLTLMSAHYHQTSAVADIIPKGLVDAGLVDPYGAIDDTDRVESLRHLVGCTWDWADGERNARIQGYYNYKDTTIWSNYTFYYWNDFWRDRGVDAIFSEPDLGDQQELFDRRHYFGVNAHYQRPFRWRERLFDTKVGIQWRLDVVDQVLANTRERDRFNVINALDFTESAVGIYLKENIVLTPWLRIVTGLRTDVFLYSGSGTQDEPTINWVIDDVEKEWKEAAWIFSPKASLIVSPFEDWEVYLNYGEGFFSNTTQMIMSGASGTVPKMRGAEIGTRLFLLEDRLSLGLSGWLADKAEELVFDPLFGRSIPFGGATRRQGFDAEVRWTPSERLYLATDFTVVRARFRDEDTPIPNVPITMMTNSVGLDLPQGLRTLVRGRYMGSRDLDQGDEADPYYVVDLVARVDRSDWAVEVAVDNLFDSVWEDSVFSYASLAEPNGEEYSGVHYTPGAPLSVRVMVMMKF